ncbi:hypothetical protein FSARC_4239 [Fusarium sarcochroum]|uniref:Uncharacterized protein n=1 Tax=Fusarium sarcochroum TaxID=1208366 RepID=A0A8H4U247_9HYPO|nr:hypothetical protein FSARC_4239 [Fusarium sarcochroum]
MTKLPTQEHPRPYLEQRAISTELSTCGYLDGDPDKKRTADSGYNCRVDTKNGLWGFCPTSVLTASDCGLAGSCIDSYDCSDGCGMTDNEDLTTFTCGRRSFCSMALLTFGVDQTYSYIACGTKAATDHYYITPTISATTTSESIEPTTSQITSVISKDTTENTAKPTQSTSSAPSDNPIEQNSSSSGGHSTNLGAIIGGVIGGLVVICGTIITVFLLRRNRNRGAKETISEQDTSKDLPPPRMQDEGKEPQELGGLSIQEMPANTHNGRRSPVELAA